MSDITLSLDVAIPLLVLAILASFFLGRRTGSSAGRLRELQSTLDAALEEREGLRTEIASYKERVTDHFTETSHRLHDLTLQYRAVYDHLAKGASELCPGGFAKLEGGLGLDALPEESSRSSEEREGGAPDLAADQEEAAALERAADDEAARREEEDAART